MNDILIEKFVVGGFKAIAYKTQMVCNSKCLEFAAKAWADYREEFKASSEGYSCSMNSEALYLESSETGEVVAILMYNRYTNTNSNDYLWVDFVSTHKDLRGIGLFSKLMSLLEKSTKHKGIKYIELGTNVNNIAMQKACNIIGMTPDSIQYRKIL